MMLLRYVMMAGAVALAGGGAGRAARPASTPGAIVSPRARQDSAELLYRAGRDAIASGDYRRAADLLERVSSRWPNAPQANDARYWRAFALYRAGGTSDLRKARESLKALRDAGSDAYRSQSASLDTRICGELAKRGDAQCAATVEVRADSTDIASAVGEVVRASTAIAAEAARAATTAAADALHDPAVQAAMADASAAARAGAAEGARAAAEAIRDATADMRDVDRSMRESRGRSRSSSDCESDDNDVKVIALNALMQMDADRALPLLKKVMASREKCSEVLRKKAVFLIAKQNTPEAADMLVDAARNDPDTDVRKEAVFWLSRVSGDKAASFLRDVALGTGDVEVRKQAVFSLSQSGTAAARETLRQIAQSPNVDGDVRGDAIFWLGQRGSTEDVDFLRTLYPKLTDREMKDKVLFAVSRRKGNGAWLLDVAQDAKEPIELRKQALFWAGQGGVPMEQLVSLYDKTSDREMKKQLVFVYQQRGGTGPGFEKLLDIGRNEKDPEIRKDAIFWLSRSKDPRALKLLEDLIGK
jgi:HEAT repeat protein